MTYFWTNYDKLIYRMSTFQSSWYHMKSVKFSATPEGLSLSAVSDSDLGSKLASFAHTA